MAEEYLDLTEVCKQLQIGEDKALQLLKSGELEAEEIEGEMRFTASTVEACKSKIADSDTFVGEEKPDTGDLLLEEEPEGAGVDLADIESEPGADESDQTSVLKPIGEADDVAAAHEEEPEFHFEDEDDATSFLDDGKTGDDELENVTLSSEESEEDSDMMVSDLLKPGGETEDVDDSLETVDLAELDGGTEGIASDTDALTEGSSAETRFVGDEGVDLGEEETIGLDGMESETTDVGGALLDIGEEGIEEETGPRQFAGVGPSRMRPAAAGDLVGVQVSKMGNAFLAISVLLLLFAGFMIISAGMGFYHNPVAQWIFKTVGNLFG